MVGVRGATANSHATYRTSSRGEFFRFARMASRLVKHLGELVQNDDAVTIWTSGGPVPGFSTRAPAYSSLSRGPCWSFVGPFQPPEKRLHRLSEGGPGSAVATVDDVRCLRRLSPFLRHAGRGGRSEAHEGEGVAGIERHEKRIGCFAVPART